MSEQPANYQDSGEHEWQMPPLAANSVSVGITEIRSSRKSVCAECGERVDSYAESCGACGASLTHGPKQIRCMHCHTTASSELTVCPGCGRELRQAPPKLMTVGAPAVLALLLVFVLGSQWERINPVSWLRSNLARGVVLVEDISARIEPEVVIVMTPIVQGNAPVGAFPPAASRTNDTMAVAMAPSAVATDESHNSDSAVVSDSTVVSMAAQDLPIGIGGPQSQTKEEVAENAGSEGDNNEAGGEETVAQMSVVVEEPTPTETPLPTETPIPTATAEPPTATPTVEPTATEAAATPTPTWTVMSAQATVTALPTSANLGQPSTVEPTVVPTTLAAGIAFNGMAAAAASAAETNQPLPTPVLVPTLVPTLGPTPTPTPFVHQVRSGDTVLSIATTYDVTVADLMAVNELSEQDVYVIQPGQMLLIPVPTPVPARLEAPLLAIPPDGAVLGCSTGGSLVWQRVQFVKDSDRYVLHLGFVSGRSGDGQESVTWVVAQNSPVTQTEWQLDTALCDLASAEYGREWRWWVEVVGSADGGALPVSPPSETRRFVWQ